MEMKKISVAVLVVMTLLLMCAGVSAVAIPGQSTGPKDSLPYNLKNATNYSSPSTVVVAVAESENYKVLGVANEIAYHENYSVLVTPPDKLSPYVTETIQQRMSYGNLSSAIVVGTHENTTEIRDLLSEMKDPRTDTELTIEDTIYEDSVYKLVRQTPVYMWDTSHTFIIQDCDIQQDYAKGLLLSSEMDAPMLCEDSGYDNITSTMEIVSDNNVSKIYVTPAVNPDLLDSLSANYTVNDSYPNIFKDFETFSADYFNGTEREVTFVVVKEPNNVTPYDTLYQFGSNLAYPNSSVLVADNSTGLGTNQTSALDSMDPNITVLVGDLSVAEDSLSNELSATTGKSPWRVVYNDNIEKTTEAGILGSGYIHPIVIPTFTQENDTFNYKFKNIGFSDVVKFSEYSLRATFDKNSGTFEDSSPTPVAQDSDTVVYEFDDEIHPMDYVTLTFVASEGSNFSTMPEMRYYSENLAGNVQPHQGFLDSLIEYFDEAKTWITDSFGNFFGVFTTVIPLPSYIAQAISTIIMLVVLWIIVGTGIYIVKDPLLGSKVTQPLLYGPVVWLIKGKVYTERGGAY